MNSVLLSRCLNIPLDRAMKWAPAISNTFGEFDIQTSLRQAAFLAQIGHESGSLQWTRELWGPTPAQIKYDIREDLGNTARQAIDFARAKNDRPGHFYRGGGLIQTTGFANTMKLSTALYGDDRIARDPGMLSLPDDAARSAGYFWKNNGLNVLADTRSFESLTRRINGGLNGLAERQAIYAVCLRELGIV